MTPEQFEQAKREFLVSVMFSITGEYNQQHPAVSICLSDLNSLLEQHKEVMMEFTEWTGSIYYDNSRWLAKGEEEMTTQELFDYWLKNVKK